MAWRFKSDWVLNNRAPLPADMDNISLDQRFWGGQVDAAGNNLINLGVVTFGAGGYIPGPVGIGRAHPSGMLLEIYSATVTGDLLSLMGNIAASGDGPGINFQQNSGSGLQARIKAVYTSGDYAMGLAFHTFNGAALAERVRIAGNGNVGIGTASPFLRADVVAPSVGYNQWGQFRIGVGPLSTDESLTIGVCDSGYSFIQAMKSGTAYRPLLLSPNGGNVGIGVANPTARLVVGASQENANLYLGGIDADYACISADRNFQIRSGSAYPIQLIAGTLALTCQPTGHVIVNVPSSAMGDGSLPNSSMVVWFDEANSRLELRCRTSGGVLKTGYIAVA